MRKTFLMAPLDFTRVSSDFNMHRLHPIYKITRPHRGTDYAAPTGTPVYAAGDGRVIQAGYNSTMGNFVAIQHSDTYVTKYLHLQKRMSDTGQRVSQGQVIGAVGSTGAATGPHLHYELYRDGRPVNPLSITFTQRAQLSGGDLSRFKGELAKLKAVKPGAALAPLPVAKRTESKEREIDRISAAKIGSGKPAG